MPRSLAIALCCAVTISLSQLSAKQLNVEVHAESAIMINADTGAVLYSKNAHTLQYPASITKVATALYALKIKGDQLETRVTAEQESIASVSEAAIRRSNYSLPSFWIEQGSSHIGIKAGEELTFRDLLYGMLLPSANDASNVIAQFVSGSIPEFMEELNEFLKNIGCKNTTFTNPHGLHHPNHQTTASDMAIIAQEALKEPVFADIVSTVRFTRPKTNKQEPSTYVQTNKLLRSGKYFYPKAVGVKTGNTSIAQNTFIGAARDNGRTLIVVTLKTAERGDIFEDAIKLFEAAFKEKKVVKTLLKSGPQKYALNLDGAEKPIKTHLEKDFKIEFYPAEEPKLKTFLQWDNVTLPIAKDQKVGDIIIKTEGGNLLQVAPLYADEDVQATWFDWFKKLFS